MEAQPRLEGGAGWRDRASDSHSLTVAEIAESLNATIVVDVPYAEEERFARSWNASLPESANLPIEPRYVGKPYARSRRTSRAAAMQADRMGAMRTRVLETLKAIGPACDDRVAYELGLDSSSVRPRRIELERSGMVRENGREKTRSGRWAIRWEAL